MTAEQITDDLERAGELLELLCVDSLEATMSSLHFHRAYQETQQVSAWFLEFDDILARLRVRLTALEQVAEAALRLGCIGSGEDMKYEEYRDLRAAMTVAEWSRVQDKARWEQMTPWRVLMEWPSLIPERLAVLDRAGREEPA